MVLLTFLIIKRSKLQSEALEKFLKAFGTFFEEFKQDGKSCWLFYLIFVVRRFSLIILIMFVNNPIIQISLSITFTLFVRSMQIPMYLLETRAFIEITTGTYIIANELLTCIYYVIIAIPLVSTTELSSTRASYICIEITLAALVLNILSNLILSVKNVKNWIKKRRDKAKNRVVPLHEIQYNIPTIAECEKGFNTNCA